MPSLSPSLAAARSAHRSPPFAWTMLGAAVGVALGQALPAGPAGAALGAGLLGGAAVLALRPRRVVAELRTTASAPGATPRFTAPAAPSLTAPSVPPLVVAPAAAPPPPPAPQPPALDGAVLLEQIAGDIDLLRELADIFDGECPARLAAMGVALAANDPERVWPIAHALKGMFATIYAEEARAIAARVEASARGGRLAEVDADLPRLNRSAQAAGAELRRLAETGAS